MEVNCYPKIQIQRFSGIGFKSEFRKLAQAFKVVVNSDYYHSKYSCTFISEVCFVYCCRTAPSVSQRADCW